MSGGRHAVMSAEIGDITRVDVDAIVNAANERLLGGGGVDGAIHRAAGPHLLAACREIPEFRPGVRCPTGEARITLGFGLRARHVIHTVGPVWHGGDRGERELLASTYRNVLALTAPHGIRSIAFPAISCGAFGFPLEDACAVAVREIGAALDAGLELDAVRLVAFDARTHAAMTAALATLGR
jgi:O-acetyl-ADP-ribose deacetylase (regulator of RNase III)